VRTRGAIFGCGISRAFRRTFSPIAVLNPGGKVLRPRNLPAKARVSASIALRASFFRCVLMLELVEGLCDA
jgi:hypothetical protein